MPISPDSADEAAATVHRALADPRRRQLVGLLREAAEPLGVAALAEMLGLHANTVRWHLRALEEAGIVSSSTLPPQGRGRPGLVYAPVQRADAGAEYRQLATLLAGTLGGIEGGGAHAEAAGRTWGAYLVDRSEPGAAAPTPAETMARVLRVLDRHGFDPVADGSDVVLRACPFGELARTHGDVICRAHRGILEGALAEIDAPLRLVAFDAFTGPGLCLLKLGPR